MARRLPKNDEVFPHSLEAERAVLGSVLIDGAAWARAATVLSESDFYREAHRLVFAAMGRLSELSQPQDFTLLCEQLRGAGVLEAVGGAVYVASLADGLPHATNVEHYARVVREKALLRKAIAAAERLLKSARADELSGSQVVEDGVRDLLGLCVNGRGASLSASEAVSQYVNSLDGGGSGRRLATGHVDLDAVIGGLRAGDLAILAARPSVGKTSLALGVGLHLARAGEPGTFFSLEMGHVGLAERLVAWGARIPGSRLGRETLTDDEYARVSAAWTALDGVGLRLEEAAGWTLTQVAARCQALQHDGGLAWAVVDYLQLLSPDRRGRSREEEVSALSRGLKRLAVDRKIAVLAVSQLSRGPEGRKDKRPQLSDLRESGALEQDADLAILLHRPEMHSKKPEDRGIAEVIVAKQRNGPTGTVRLAWRAELAQFSDLARQEEAF